MIQVFKTFFADGKIKKTHKNFKKLEMINRQVVGLKLPFNSEFKNLVNNLKKEHHSYANTLNSKFNFKEQSYSALKKKNMKND